MSTREPRRGPALGRRDAEVVELPRRGGPPGSGLPAELTRFVGRDRELAEVLEALAAARVLTLTGAGGCGKTRLARRAAAEALASHPDGAWWIELAPLGDPALIAPALATALGVRPLPGQGDLEAAVGALAARRALVLLDNCEHLVDEAARVADALARGCPDVTVLATSREPLGVPGEIRWRVPSLSVPGDDDAASALAPPSDAVRLFVERAGRARPGFTLTPANAPAVARICRELDGMPLAIELAAARMGALSAEAVADALADRFRVLTGGPRTALPRHRTLRASVDWSHDLLGEPERVLFRRLGVFAGGFGPEAAERVCSGRGIDAADVLALLASLVERSLATAEDHDGAVRFRLLETVRGYALERLAAAGEERWARERHRDAFLEAAEAAAPGLLTPRRPAALDALDLEAANLAQALAFAAETDPESALRLCIALGPWWRLRALHRGGRRLPPSPRRGARRGHRPAGPRPLGPRLPARLLGRSPRRRAARPAGDGRRRTARGRGHGGALADHPRQVRPHARAAGRLPARAGAGVGRRARPRGRPVPDARRARPRLQPPLPRGPRRGAAAVRGRAGGGGAHRAPRVRREAR